MSRIRSQGTLPEIVVRRLVQRLGYRYRLHVVELPGKPDLGFPRLKRIIEVQGCFWHQHPGCIDSHIPKTRQEYWVPKLERNQRRDEENRRRLAAMGWQVLVVWACETADVGALSGRLVCFLGERPLI